MEVAPPTPVVVPLPKEPDTHVPIEHEYHAQPIQIVKIVHPVIVEHEQLPEVPQRQVKVEPEPEVKQPPVEEKTSTSEEYSSDSEEKASERGKKRKVRYEGQGGRIHTEAQIDELLDFWLMTGELPLYVSDRQRYDYRHHERLPERVELLEQRGISIVVTVPGTTGHIKNVIPIKGTNVQRKTGTSS